MNTTPHLSMNPAGRPTCGRPGRAAARPCPVSGQSGFTMIEIALSLAIIGFALVAIIGVLPTGLNVQKGNREETIINQDAAVWMDAIRHGAQGYDDLTNYVIAITNTVWSYTLQNGVFQPDGSVSFTGSGGGSPEINVFTRTSWSRNGAVQSGASQLLLTNGYNIIGALSRPKLEWTTNNAAAHFFSNYIVANVRSMSGSAVEKYPENNATVLDNAFSYRMIAEIDSYVPFDPGTTNVSPTLNLTLQQRAARISNSTVVSNLLANSHDLRLTFRWPLLPSGDAGNGRQTFRTFSGGQILQTSDLHDGVAPLPLYFLEPSTYVRAQ
jgi:prepilin-type N-terminal cleavage/methylation domain-containing protein